MDNRNHCRCYHLRRPTLHSLDRCHPRQLLPPLPRYPRIPHPTTTQPPMSDETITLALLFSSAFVGATIVVLAALVTSPSTTKSENDSSERDSLFPQWTPEPRAPASPGAPRTAPTKKCRPPRRPRTGPGGSSSPSKQRPPGPACTG